MREIKFFWLFLFFLAPFLRNSDAGASENRQILPVVELRQKYPFTCEAAALRMVLHYFDVKISEDEILAAMPVDGTPRKNGVWGDPDQAFVGDIYGNNSQVSYGIHWRPMQGLASRWARAEAFENQTPTDITSFITKRLPVVAWVNGGTGKPLKWKTPKGKSISAIEGEHSVVVYGFKGTAEKPVGFFIMDPKHGPQFKETKEFVESWNKLGKSILVLYGKKDG